MRGLSGLCVLVALLVLSATSAREMPGAAGIERRGFLSSAKADDRSSSQEGLEAEDELFDELDDTGSELDGEGLLIVSQEKADEPLGDVLVVGTKGKGWGHWPQPQPFFHHAPAGPPHRVVHGVHHRRHVPGPHRAAPVVVNGKGAPVWTPPRRPGRLHAPPPPPMKSYPTEGCFWDTLEVRADLLLRQLHKSHWRKCDRALAGGAFLATAADGASLASDLVAGTAEPDQEVEEDELLQLSHGGPFAKRRACVKKYLVKMLGQFPDDPVFLRCVKQVRTAREVLATAILGAKDLALYVGALDSDVLSEGDDGDDDDHLGADVLAEDEAGAWRPACANRLLLKLARDEGKAVRACIADARGSEVKITTAAPLAPLPAKTGLPKLPKMMNLDLDKDVKAHAGPLFSRFIKWMFTRYPGLGVDRGVPSVKKALKGFGSKFKVDVRKKPRVPLYTVLGSDNSVFPVDGTTVYDAPPWERRPFRPKTGVFNPYDVIEWKEGKKLRKKR